MRKRITSLLLTLVMLLSLVPAMGVTASAADTSWTTVNTYDELKAALSTQNPPDNIKLGCDIDTGTLNSGVGILESLEVKGRKQLDLNGHTLRMYSEKTAVYDMFTIKHGDLTVLDSSSGQKGTILGSTYNDSCYLFDIQSYGQLTLNSGTLKVDVRKSTSDNTWRRVIYCYAGGTVTINGGTLHVAPETYEGKNNAYGQYFEEPYRDLLNGHCGYTLMAANSCKVSINGGTFQGPVRLDAGGSDWKQNVPRVWISGGTFEKKVMLNGPGDGTRPLTIIRGGVFLDYVQAWAAASFAEENPFTASEVTVNGGEFHDTFWIRPFFPSSSKTSYADRAGYHLSAKLMNTTIYKRLTAEPASGDLYRVPIDGSWKVVQKTADDIYNLASEVLGRSAVQNNNGIFSVLNKSSYRKTFSYYNTGNPKTEGHMFELKALSGTPTTIRGNAWGFVKAELDGSEITMGSLRDGVTFIGGGVPSYTVNTSGMRTINFYWYDLPQVMKDNNYRCVATCEVNGTAVTLSKDTNPATGITKGRYIIPNSTVTTKAKELTFQVRLEWYNGSTWEQADSSPYADMYLLKYNVVKDSTIPIETVLLDMVNGDLLPSDSATANPIRTNAMDVRCEKVVKQTDWADNGDHRNKSVTLKAQAGFRFTRDTRFVVKNAGSVTAKWTFSPDGGETCVIGIEAQECTLLPTVQGTLKNFYMGRQMGEAYITADSPAGCTFEIFEYACLGEATDEWEPIDDDREYYEYYFYIVPPSGYAVRPRQTKVNIVTPGGYGEQGEKYSDYKREAEYDYWMTSNYSYSYGYSWNIGRLVDGRYGMFPEYERTTRTLYLNIKEPVAGENPNTDRSYKVIDGLPDDVTVDKFEWEMKEDTVFQAGKEYMLVLYLTVPKEDPDGVWAKDPKYTTPKYITVYINGVNCNEYNAWQSTDADYVNCEWGIADWWLTPISGDIQTVSIEVEEPVAGQPLNFHVQSLGEPEAYMAGAYPHDGEQYDAFWIDTTGGGFEQLNPGAVARSDGGTYRLMVFVHPKEGHQFAKATEKTRTFWVNGQKAKGSCNTDGSQAQVDYTFTFPAAEAGAGVTVSGTAVSWNDTNDAQYYLYPSTTEDADIRAQWKKGVTVSGYSYTGTGGAVTATTVDGKAMKAQTFSFGTIPAGEYKLVIFKPGKYVPKIVPITVESTALDLGQLKLWLYGDVNYDGVVNGKDAMQIDRFAAGMGSVFAPEKNTPEQLAERLLAADVNQDGSVTSKDAMQIDRMVSGMKSAFDKIP